MSDVTTSVTENQAPAQVIRFFHQLDNNVYHVTCKMIISQGSFGNSAFWDDDSYDYEFFFHITNGLVTVYHVMCKLISNPLIVNMLNKEIYGMDFVDINNLNRNYSLTSYQKYNLELSLRQLLSSYIS
jgi:hypothetical protein